MEYVKIRRDTDEEVKTEEATLNSFNYFCVFCLRLTLWNNKGNFASCQECGIYGSNFGASCAVCKLADLYVYWSPDFEPNKGDSPESAVCSKCSGAALWSGDAPQISAACRLCLEQSTINDYGVL